MKKKLSFFLVIIFIINTLALNPDTSFAAEYPAAPEVSGSSAILMEADTGAVLYEKNSHKKLYPASITKIMTGLLTIENCNMEDIVIYSGKALSSLPFDAAKLGLVSGEEMTVKDSLYALLLRSCNDAAVGLAYHISGSEEEFAKLMTKRAKELGATDTSFVNASGLQDENHYTTAYDMAMITKAAINNPIFAEISGTESYVLPTTNKCNVERTQVNRHQMLVSTSTNYYPYAIAGKTGYTDEAGRTLVTVAKKDGKTLICVFMNSTDEEVFNDTKNLFEYGFNHFDKVNIAENETRFNQDTKDFFVKMKDVFVNQGGLLNVGKGDYVMVPEGASMSDLKYEVEYLDDTSKGEVAQVKYYFGNKYMGSTKLSIEQKQEETGNVSPVKTEQDNESSKIANIPINIWLFILGILVLIGIIVYIVYFIKTKDKRKRKRERRRVFKESKQRFKRRKRRKIKFR